MGYRAKTVKKVIREKIDQWLATIEDEYVRGLASKGTIVTGGAIASMLLDEKVNDFDIYFKDHRTTLAVAKYYVARFKTKEVHGIKCKIYVEDGPAIHTFEEDGAWLTKESTAYGSRIKRELAGGDDEEPDTDTANDNFRRIRVVVKSAGVASEAGTEKPYRYFEGRPADAAGSYVGEVMGDPGDIQDQYEQTEEEALEVEDDDKPKYRPVFLSSNAITLSNKLQIILRFYGEPDVIHTNFDFAHCTNYWCSWNNELTLRPVALECLLAKELRYVGSKYPVCSVIRLRKFIGRQWKINAGQILKMMMQISKLDLTDPLVLEDQLTGVDAAYFIQLMSALKAKDPEKVNTAYLIEIIDRMF